MSPARGCTRKYGCGGRRAGGHGHDVAGFGARRLPPLRPALPAAWPDDGGGGGGGATVQPAGARNAAPAILTSGRIGQERAHRHVRRPARHHRLGVGQRIDDDARGAHERVGEIAFLGGEQKIGVGPRIGRGREAAHRLPRGARRRQAGDERRHEARRLGRLIRGQRLPGGVGHGGELDCAAIPTGRPASDAETGQRHVEAVEDGALARGGRPARRRLPAGSGPTPPDRSGSMPPISCDLC